MWITGVSMLTLGSHMWYLAASWEILPVNPRDGGEILGLRFLTLIFWIFGLSYLVVMLRARHAVTIGVMLAIEASRPLRQIGNFKLTLLTFVHFLGSLVFYAVTGTGVLLLATMESTVTHRLIHSGPFCLCCPRQGRHSLVSPIRQHVPT